MADFLFLEQLHRMIHEIPRPRLMYKKGIMAKGFFKPYMTFRDYTKAEIFSDPETSCNVEVRFASMLGEKGSADTVRNIKGLSAKFYTEEGEYDLICQSLPVYFISHGEKFLKMCEAFAKNAPFDGVNSEKFWTFVIENPESVNCALRFFSNKGLQDSYVNSDWYSVNTYVWENSLGKKLPVRYMWRTVNYEKAYGGRREVDRAFAEFMAGFDPDTAGDELKRNIAEGDFPTFELSVQMADYRFLTHPYYLKRTVCWDESVIPYVKVGVMKLTDISEDRSDLRSFAPGNLIKGIELCGDEFSEIMDYAHKIGAMGRGGGG